jgi:hypothetical protein
MMEILINENEWNSNEKTRRLTEILDCLGRSGWERFGHAGTIVLFKDTSEEKAVKELQEMKISEIRAESWEEDLYTYSVF